MPAIKRWLQVLKIDRLPFPSTIPKLCAVSTFCPAGTGHAHVSRQASADLIHKEGFLYKKGGMIKSWSRRYFILMGQSLCYFKREFETQEGLEPLGRIFLSDIVNIQTEGVEKRKAFVFALHTKKRAVLLQAANSEDRDKWVDSIRNTQESDKEAERKDPFRKTLRKLAPGGWLNGSRAL